MTAVSTRWPTIALGDARVGFRGRITALDMTRAPAAGLPAARAGAPADRAGLRRGRHGRAAAPGPVRRRSDRRARGRTRPSRCAAARPWRSWSRRGKTEVPMNVIRRPRSRRCAGRQSQLRQDGAVQCPDRQPPEGRQLSRRHGREEDRPAHDAGRPRRSRSSTCRAPIRCAPARPDEEITRDVGAGQARERARARPDRLRRRRLQPAPGAAPRARAEAGRPAGADVPQHDGHRQEARHRDRRSSACRASSACRS